MSDYRYPLNDITFSLQQVAGFSRVNALRSDEVSEDLVDAILNEAGKLCEQVIAPINHSGDQEGSRIVNGSVHEAKGFKKAFKSYVEGGWGSLSGAEEYGGQGLPFALSAAVSEGVQAANLAFSLCPLLNQGAIEAIETHASNELKETYLPKMISGEWVGSMNLTEPAAGSDLAAIQTKAIPEDKHYRLFGQKIFITWGDHQMTDNIIHLVLARLPDAPEGVKGISLFIVPKFLLDEAGNPTTCNDVVPVSVEKKLGIHASPTCVMSFGDNEGAIGYLVGEENRGLMAMFTMMNNARQGVGLQGLAISERAYQQALEYAQERKQGVAKDRSKKASIIEHPDVLRMLMTMKSQIDAMRSLVYSAAVEIDLANLTEGKEQANHNERNGILTPIVKGWITEQAQEITSLAIQVHGGVGFIEETGVAQHARDARILPIYEGTNGIQALDLIGRKLHADQGKGMSRLLADIESELTSIETETTLPDVMNNISLVRKSLNELDNAQKECLKYMNEDPVNATGSAYSLMMLMGYTIGGWLQIKAQSKVSSSSVMSDIQKSSWNQSVNFYCKHILPRTNSYYQAIMFSSTTISDLSLSSFSR
ncbi:acyl-CoA dehydrogenase family protein [Marinomonas algicola]|uniref:acyl-CoA dehydrogenase family protein n=1 Tax=Marinomonas algicola TaxID=2773454 RepID=UPI00174DC051|nr:acyl-CoA dehydrogenase family protein [Marinomonas algicola]